MRINLLMTASVCLSGGANDTMANGARCWSLFYDTRLDTPLEAVARAGIWQLVPGFNQTAGLTLGAAQLSTYFIEIPSCCEGFF
jgi:hypothetical protein